METILENSMEVLLGILVPDQTMLISSQQTF